MVQLLCVCLQWRVFRLELAAHTRNDYGGGDNDEILPEVEANLKIPVEDFTITTGCVVVVYTYKLYTDTCVYTRYIGACMHTRAFISS